MGTKEDPQRCKKMFVPLSEDGFYHSLPSVTTGRKETGKQNSEQRGTRLGVPGPNLCTEIVWVHLTTPLLSLWRAGDGATWASPPPPPPLSPSSRGQPENSRWLLADASVSRWGESRMLLTRSSWPTATSCEGPAQRF
jgi:hypothetical protein